MKKNNLLDFLIILLLEIAVACFPFSLFIKIDWLVLTLQILLSIGFFIFAIFYVKKRTQLEMKNEKLVIRNTLFLIPTLLVCFSNYFYLLFTKNFNGIDITYIFALEATLTVVQIVNEELVFRLILVSNLETESKLKKILISAAVFGLCHLTVFLSTFNPVDLLMILYTFALGLLLAFAYVSTKSIYPSIAIHFLFNLINGLVYDKITLKSFDMWQYILINGAVALVVGIYVAILFVLENKPQKDAQ